MNLYRYEKMIDVPHAPMKDLMFIDQMDKFVGCTFNLKLPQATESSVTVFLELNAYGEMYARKARIEPANLIDSLVETFEVIYSYRDLFPYTNISSLEEFQEEAKIFSTWVVSAINQKSFNILTKENYIKLRSNNGENS